MMRLGEVILTGPPTLTLPHAGGGKRLFRTSARAAGIMRLRGQFELLPHLGPPPQRGEGGASGIGCCGFEGALPSPRCGGGSGWGGLPDLRGRSR